MRPVQVTPASKGGSLKGIDSRRPSQSEEEVGLKA
jgi:hypothetical protein